MTEKKTIDCKKIQIEQDVCYVLFGDKKDIDHQIELGITSRNEEMIADVDRDGRIIGIELLGSPEAQKPCQQAIKDEMKNICNYFYEKNREND